MAFMLFLQMCILQLPVMLLLPLLLLLAPIVGAIVLPKMVQLLDFDITAVHYVRDPGLH